MALSLVSFLLDDGSAANGQRPNQGPTVQLLHALPNGSKHVDWMIGSNSASERLITFRLSRPMDEMAAGSCWNIVRLPDHRRKYLDYEGPISDNRGQVRRLRRGVWHTAEAASEVEHVEVMLKITWFAAERRETTQAIRLWHEQGDDWMVEILSTGPVEGVRKCDAIIARTRTPIGAKES